MVGVLVEDTVIEALVKELGDGLLHPAVAEVLQVGLRPAGNVVHVALVDRRHPLESASASAIT